MYILLSSNDYPYEVGIESFDFAYFEIAPKYLHLQLFQTHVFQCSNGGAGNSIYWVFRILNCFLNFTVLGLVNKEKRGFCSRKWLCGFAQVP